VRTCFKLRGPSHDEKDTITVWAALRQQGDVADAIPCSTLGVPGNWTGSYENSRGGSGLETLAISRMPTVTGRLVGSRCHGKRLGNSMFFWKEHRSSVIIMSSVTLPMALVLNYLPTTADERYTGQSTLSA